MKESSPSISVLGTNSSINAGDAATLASVMGEISDTLNGNVRFEVLTNDREFVEGYEDLFNVRPLSCGLWNLSVGLFGIPALLSVRRTDLSIIIGRIVSDVKLFNPFANSLIALALLVFWAKRQNKAVVCYNIRVGPLKSALGRRLARFVINNSAYVTVAEEESKKVLRELGVVKAIVVTADSILNNWTAPAERLEQIVTSLGFNKERLAKGILGLSVSLSSLDSDSFLNQVCRKSKLLEVFSKVAARLKFEREIEVMLFSTDLNDLTLGRALQDRIAKEYQTLSGNVWTPALINNVDYDNHELCALVGKCKIFVGMQYHALLFAIADGVPAIGILAESLTRGLVKQISSESWALEVDKLYEDQVYELLAVAWQQAEKIARFQGPFARELQGWARSASLSFAEKYLGASLGKRTSFPRVVNVG